MRILVTGLDGFTGRYVKAELESTGHSVVGLVSDLTDPDAVTAEVSHVQPEAIVHLAGIAFVGHGNANAFYEVNLIGTRNLLDAVASVSHNVKSILLASSANVYGNQHEGVLSEDTAPDPANDYAVSKHAMEEMARLWMDRLPLFIVRPFNYTGIGQDEKFLIPKIVKHFRERQPVIQLGNIDVWREFGDVRVVANLYKTLLEKCPVGETLNVCTGKTYSLKQVITLCEEISGHRIEIEVNPEFVRDNEVRVLAGNNDRLKAHIGDWNLPDLGETLSWMLRSDPL